ncbi:putative folate-biopterin transporter 2 [Dichanthelium oligosanthes]|uniref:Putative folate-biopterin transporter 2 n=1 Tax=Dichanthelium oligosanthes TaxID=888268 RepID=A0A1E5VZ94_9POAL|nr:putative folate-biopterin transporter 2 [Dichanthelium oligosanthes]
MEPPEDEILQLQDAGGGGGSVSISHTQGGSNGECCVASPGVWLGRLSRELHWSFLLAVVAVYGACQGVGDALNGVASGYYWKDVQRVQPSAAQFYQGVTGAPWVVKPLWGLLTDVIPVAGYRRRPYLVVAGVIGVTSMLMLSLHRELGIMAAVLVLTAQSTGAAIADVTVDALVAQKSITHPPLASDMQSMCGFSSSVGALLGFSISGLLVHSVGSQGALGLLAIPSALVFSAGILLKESPATDFDYTQVHKKFYKAVQSMGDPARDPTKEGFGHQQAGQMEPREDDGALRLQEPAGCGCCCGIIGKCRAAAGSPCGWLRRLSRELHWSFVLAVVAVYGACQGVGNALGCVAAGYYWKDVQRVQPSAAQFYQGVTDAPWVVKPLWGLLTDVVPVAGYRRRPYFVLAGVIGVSSMLMLSLHPGLGIMPALLALTAQSAGAAIADVTVDALVAQNSITHPPLASDMQSLCGFGSSVGALLGFSISGLLVHSMGAQGALGLLSIPSVLVLSAGILLKENRAAEFDYKQVHKKFYKAIQSMGTTLKCPELRQCFVAKGTYGTFALVQGYIGLIYSIGSVGSLLGVLLYQSTLKDYPFRSMLLWAQVLSSLAGMLDLVLVTRLNLKIGIPDYFFAVADNGISQMVGRLKWLPLLVLCSKLCSPGVEGTFYALLMSLQNAGLLMSAWWGGLLLHMLNVTRMEFSNLWIAVLIRNISRLVPLALLFLVPQSDQNSTLLAAEILQDTESTEAVKVGPVEFSVLVPDDSGCISPNMVAEDDVELIPLVDKSGPTRDS